YSIPGYATAFRGAALADVDNDNQADVVFATSNGLVIALKGTNGTPLWSINLVAHYGDTLDFDHAPVIADFDADDTLDLFVVGGQAFYPDFQHNNGRGYALSIGKGNGPDWLMFQNDIRRQSSLCGNTPISVNENKSNTTSVLVFPNPGTSSVTIEIPHSKKEDQLLVIYNSKGQLIRKIVSVSEERILIETRDWQAGLYFFQLSDKSGCSAQGKFIVE
ncbi:MAG TPA: T9SS type A sorting domain-containing protein, partial [Bacteroidales bacterium]|nr:T9SS type A sorting domain-containing protein [Bacteroidales bacterium]